MVSKQSIINNYVLVRTNLRTRESQIILQSNDRKELMQFKGILESNLPMDLFNSYQYMIKGIQEVSSEINMIQ